MVAVVAQSFKPRLLMFGSVAFAGVGASVELRGDLFWSAGFIGR